MRRERTAVARKKNKESMTKFSFVTAAFAAGMIAMTPVAEASNNQRDNWRTTSSAVKIDSSTQRAESASKASVLASNRSAWRAAPVNAKVKSNSANPGVDPVTTSSVAAGAARPATKGKSGGSPYETIIARHAAEHGVPLALARAVVRVESNFRADARGRAGEVGLMQIKPATARGMGYRGSTSGLYDPETNIRYGMKYLAGAHRLGGGDTCGTILRYNAGHGAKRMNKISAAYCVKVKRHMGGA